MGCFFIVRIREEMIIGCCCAMLIYVNPSGNKDLDRWCCEGEIPVCMKALQTYTVHISYDVKHSRDVRPLGHFPHGPIHCGLGMILST